MNWLSGHGAGPPGPAASVSAVAQGPDGDIPAAGQQFAQFGAGCFWSVELAFQRVPGVTKTEVGYSQGFVHDPSYSDVCSGNTNHSEVARVQYNPKECTYEDLLRVFWTQHDPTSLNRQIKRQIQLVNEVYKLHNLPEFYKDPRPHISVCWALGDISTCLKGVVQEVMKGRGTATGLPQRYNVFCCKFNGIECKIGNKTYKICKLSEQ